VNLILLEPGEVGAAGDVTLTDARARHLLTVLNVAPGDYVRVGVIDGPRGAASVQSSGHASVSLRCAFEADTPPRPAVDLLLALPRPKVMRRLWAQIAASGVGRIIVTNAERVERDYFDAHILTPACYRPLLIEGLQQARDTRMPAVSIHKRFKVLVEDELDGLFEADALRLVAEPGAQTSVSAAIREHAHQAADGRIVIAVGPEGGWNAFEIGLLEAHGFRPVGMGPRTLRADTACVALLAIVNEATSLRPLALTSRTSRPTGDDHPAM
jgi:RsmE family RNA methyltransferase